MTKDEIKQRMSDAGLKTPARGDFIFIHWDQIALLIEHERAVEREACAKVCDDLDDDIVDGLAGWQYGEAIRARGQA